jgi:hypothetical protein
MTVAADHKATSNYDTALKAEAKKVIRCFQRYTSDQVAALYARTGRPSRDALDRGHFFYVHPAVPGVAFDKRLDAARAGIKAEA